MHSLARRAGLPAAQVGGQDGAERRVPVGAVNEDEANELADRLEGEVPEGARVEVEPGGQMIWENVPQNPFVVFGGLGGSGTPL